MAGTSPKLIMRGGRKSGRNSYCNRAQPYKNPDIGMALRKIALLLKPDKEIDHQGNHMTVKTLSTFHNYILEFEVGVEFEEDLRNVDGRKCQTIVTWEEEQLVCVQKGEVPNRGWRHWLEGEKLYLELTARDAVCEQVFRKVK
ncbi:retinol-binding protein 5 isoform X2 [Ursus americanus]|uniref:retinol-binding protein 5 isoform X2 n=1 Tax=Ursus americanus TaxID=9643 RepID=UPI001E67B2B5|nr:retinol-binding protein 5 isoform X2 [Ursus americanus]